MKKLMVWLTLLLTGHFPLDTTKATAEPKGAELPANGFWLMTKPFATVLLHCWVTVPTVRLEPVRAVTAAAWVMPTTSSTGLVNAGKAIFHDERLSRTKFALTFWTWFIATKQVEVAVPLHAPPHPLKA